MKADDIIAKIRAALPDAEVELQDLTGTADHWKATIVSAGFSGKSLMARHRLVMAALAEELKGPIHALTLDVKTPEETRGRDQTEP
jgi:stress-induced morphogen